MTNKENRGFIKSQAQCKLIGCEEDFVLGENVEKGVDCAENTLDYAET